MGGGFGDDESRMEVVPFHLYIYMRVYAGSFDEVTAPELLT